MIKIAINGFGRIGRPTFKRIIENHKNVQVVAINDLTDTKTLTHLLKYDSVYGIYNKQVSCTDKAIKVAGKTYPVLAEKDPTKLPWKKLGVDVVLECTGFFADFQGAKKHLRAGAKKVIISAPCKDKEVPTYVLGVNEEKYNPGKEHVLSMGSCTTNALVPVVKVINDNFEIEKALMTTIHSYTSTQKIVDGPHKDLRRGRAAAVNIVPTTTGAAISVIRVLPELKGKLDGIAVRVPSIDVSLIDFVAQVKKQTTVEKINKVFKQVSQKKLKGILSVENEPLVSTDFIGNPYSAIIDSQMTRVENKNLVKVLAWYDNEWGYACRLAEFAEYTGKKA
jgi:glyceraldehyde 3-phosphate dehydrogenase